MYAGSTIYNGSTSSTLVQVVNAATGTATTTSLAPSANPASSSGQPVVFTATVSGAGSPSRHGDLPKRRHRPRVHVLNGGQASFASGAFAAGAYSWRSMVAMQPTRVPLRPCSAAIRPPPRRRTSGSPTATRRSPVRRHRPHLLAAAGYSAEGSCSGRRCRQHLVRWLGQRHHAQRLGAGAQTFTGGGIATPVSIGIAGDGSVWIANTRPHRCPQPLPTAAQRFRRHPATTAVASIRLPGSPSTDPATSG